MKRKLSLAFAAISILAVSSCGGWLEKGENVITYSSVVTLRPQEDKSFYMTQNDSVAFVPVNSDLAVYPYKDLTEKRAVIYFTEAEPRENSFDLDSYRHVVNINVISIDTLAIKPVTVYDPLKDASYGSAAVGLYYGTPGIALNTEIVDGYLNLGCFFYLGDGSVKHELTLLGGVNPENPYELELRHNANGDYVMTSKSFIYNFSLKDLPDTKGEEVDLIIRWNSLSSGKTDSMTLKYRTRDDWRCQDSIDDPVGGQEQPGGM